GTEQHVPMSPAGKLRKGGRNRKEAGACLRESAVEMGKAHIVADAHPKLAPGEIRQYELLAGPKGCRLPVALAVGNIDVEHVNLGVARDDRALWVEKKAPVGCLLWRELDGK